MSKRYFLLFLSVLISGVITAQNTGSLSGYVVDAKTEEPLIGVAVRLAGTDVGAITDIDGFFRIDNIMPNTYTVEASYLGYSTQTIFNVVIRSGGVPDINFRLEESVETLGEVVIVANPFEKLEETPLSIQKLSAEEVATYPGGNNDIAKVVQSLPGVSGSVGGFRNDVIIRGGAPNENVYYLDGIEIPNINHFATQGSAGGPVGLLNVSFFEGVTLSTSAFGAQYDNVLSGVLQFDQRNGNNRNYRSNIRVSSSEAALTLEGPLFRGASESANTSFIASVRRSYLQLLFQAIGLPFLPDYWDYQYKISHKIDDYNDLIVTGIGSIDDISVNVPDEYDAEQQAILDQIPIIQQQTNTAGISWKRRFKDKSGFMTTALSNNRLYNDFRQYTDNENQTGLFLRNESVEMESKLRYSITRFLGDWTWALGTVFQRADYHNATQNLVNDFDYDNQFSFYRYGFYGQGSRTFYESRLSFSAGLRVDGNTFMTEGNEIWRTVSPRLSVSYALDEAQKWKLNASVGRYYKIPPYTILGFQDTTGIYQNKDASYIKNDHAVAGLEYLLNPSSRITVEGFYKSYENYPVSITDSVSLANLGGDFSVLGNEPIASVGLGRSYGVELLYQKKFTKNYYAILAITLYRSEFTGFDTDNFVSSSWDNGRLLTFTGGYKFGNNWELSARVRYLGETPYAPVDLAATQIAYPAIIRDYSRQGSVTLDPFNQTDIRLDKKWNLSGFTLDLFLEVQNAFAQDLPTQPSYGLSRNELGEVITPEQVVPIASASNSSVLPSLGIVIDF
jgi:hypothetical protein